MQLFVFGVRALSTSLNRNSGISNTTIVFESSRVTIQILVQSIRKSPRFEYYTIYIIPFETFDIHDYSR